MTVALSLTDTGGQESSRIRCLQDTNAGLGPAVRTNLLLARSG